MRAKFLLLFFIFSTGLYAQEIFTRPDSLSVLKNHIESVRISKDKEVLLTLKYDTLGRCIYEREKNQNYFKKFDFDSLNRRNSVRFCSINDEEGREGTGAILYDYYPSGKIHHWKLSAPYVEILTFDTLGRHIQEETYHDTLCLHFEKEGLNSDGKCIYSLDSTTTFDSIKHKFITKTYEWKYGLAIRFTEYDNFHWVWNTELTYDSLLHLQKVVEKDPFEKHQNIYRYTYDHDTISNITENGKRHKREPYNDPLYEPWFSWKTPLQSDDKPPTESKTIYIHQMKRDYDGNIISDSPETSYSIVHNFAVTPYEYFYTYFPIQH